MNLKEKFAEIKKILLDMGTPVEPPAVNTPAQQSFTDYQLQDGTPVQISDLAQGGTVTINGQPAPDGTLTLQDGTIIVVQSGIIASIQPAAPQPQAQAQPAPAMMSAEEFNTFKTDFESYKQGIEQQFAAQTQIIEAQKVQLAKQQEVLDKLFKVVEGIANLPAENPAEVPKNNFSAVPVKKKEELLEALSKNLKELKK